MKPLTNTQLNRIKIKNLMTSVRDEISLKSGLGIYIIESYNRIETHALVNATDDDLRSIERLFIKHKLGIEYFPSQNKKKIKIDGESKIVPIDYDYGSENS